VTVAEPSPVPRDVGREDEHRRRVDLRGHRGGVDRGHAPAFDTVFWGVAYGSRAAVTHFRERHRWGADTGQALINVGSFYGDRATPLQSTYGSAKSAVHGFTEGLRVELATRGSTTRSSRTPSGAVCVTDLDPERPDRLLLVSVTMVHPGRIDTPYNEHAHSYAEHHPSHHGIVYPPEAVASGILRAAARPTRDV
jgi:NAD(P)-dependent dehydrogenase (short-subunit alcohol dehydrogenase family)